MRFHFCGGLDCPDWVLAQIALLSKLVSYKRDNVDTQEILLPKSSIKVKLLCTEAVSHLVNTKINYEKLEKLTADAKFGEQDTKGSFSALTFIILAAAKYNTDPVVLGNELQQLGFPKEHASAISKVFGDKLEPLRVALKDKSLKFNQLKNVEWSVSELENFDVETGHVTLTIETNGEHGTKNHEIVVTEDRLSVLLNGSVLPFTTWNKILTQFFPPRVAGC